MFKNFLFNNIIFLFEKYINYFTELKNILICLCSFLNEKNITIDEIINILLKSGSSYNIINNIKNINFSLVKLVLEIGINANDKKI